MNLTTDGLLLTTTRFSHLQGTDAKGENVYGVIVFTS